MRHSCHHPYRGDWAVSPRQACLHIVVSGVVQGVGFRYFTARLARQYELVGYVKNLPDGTVETEVEGDRGLLGDFLKGVSIGPRAGYVSDVEVEWKPYTGAYKGFHIRF